MSNYSLEFFMPLPQLPVSHLITGSLTLIKNGMLLLQIKASSGQSKHQFLDHYWETGKSPIPPGQHYSLNLRWVEPVGNEKLAMGSRFYYISPDPIVKGDGTHKREGIGLHYDANYDYSPGSAGCIAVLPKEPEDYGWAKMMHELDHIYNSGIKSIPLVVRYK